jgi:hypothetical protein
MYRWRENQRHGKMHASPPAGNFFARIPYRLRATHHEAKMVNFRVRLINTIGSSGGHSARADNRLLGENYV